MTISTTNFTLGERQGRGADSPTRTHRVTLTGDSSYLTGGSASFETHLAAKLEQHAIEVTDVTGYGLTAGAITHLVRWDNTNGKLLCYVLAGTQVPNATDLSAVSFDLTVTCR